MSKVYMIFLLMLSGFVQLSQAKPSSSPEVYGTLYFFRSGTLNSVLHLNDDEPSMTTIFSSELVKEEDCPTRRQNIYNIDVINDGTCYFTCLFLILDKCGGFLRSLNIRGVGVCQPNQKMVRWHIKAEQTVDGWHDYDFVFVRDPEQEITEENLNQLSPTPVIGHELI
jgi:hypothetical protein